MLRTQAHRQTAINTPLGEDILLLKSLSATEELGRLFQFEVEMLSEIHTVSFAAIVGQNATIRLSLPEGGTRYFNGYVNRFQQAPNQGKLACYQATLVPWLWFLTRVADCHIYQELSAPGIIEQVFRNRGFTDFKNSLSASYRTRDYCVQYRESDFNFVSRLMEEEGIYYFFEHDNGKHTLVLADSKSAHTVFPGYEQIPHRYLAEAGPDEEYLFDWRVEQQVQPGVVCLHAFDFQKPAASLTVKANVIRQHAVPQFEVFDYPGGYAEYADGESCARCRIEELQVQHERAQAQSLAQGAGAGFLFTLEGHPRADQNREYLITTFSCRITGDPYGSGREAEAEDFFAGRLTALNSDTPFRSARLTPKPVVTGPQTALVVGPSGEEIYTDKYGRVKVQFHWDRYGKSDENSSCWIRVSQGWAGKGWGAVSIPRIGQEVVVDFLEGDPDRPLITGRVYNATAHVPYSLPAHKTVSTFKTNSTKGGQGFNEIRFEDKKGEEQIFIHGEKNHDLRIKHDAFEWIGHDRHLIVKNDQVEQVENDRQEKIKRDHVEEIGRDHHLTIKGKEAIKITGSHSITVEDDVIEVFTKNQSTQVTKNLYVKGENIVIEATKNITINVGDSYIAIESGGIKIATNGDIVLDALGNIKAKAIQDVKLEATANAGVKGTAGLKLESPAPAELSSSAILTLKGSLVKIN